MGRTREKRETERHFIYYDLKVSGSKGINEMGFAWNNSNEKKNKNITNQEEVSSKQWVKEC